MWCSNIPYLGLGNKNSLRYTLTIYALFCSYVNAPIKSLVKKKVEALKSMEGARKSKENRVRKRMTGNKCTK